LKGEFSCPEEMELARQEQDLELDGAEVPDRDEGDVEE
jgi:hypothetical protein